MGDSDLKLRTKEYAPYLVKRHIPTERISVEEFLRFVIEELRVQPIRNDWNDILKSNYQLHKKYRTWPK